MCIFVKCKSKKKKTYFICFFYLQKHFLYFTIFFSKGANIDSSWTMTDLLQINPSSNILQISTPKKTDRNINLNNKRPSNISSIDQTNNKRVKPSTQSTCEPQSSPQLLQQLMAPSPTPHRARSRNLEKDIRWNIENGGGGGGGTPQPSNSVLMNLLVSGCDVSAGYICLLPMRTTKKTAKA